MQDVERNKAVMWRQNERNDWPECMTALGVGPALIVWQLVCRSLDFPVAVERSGAAAIKCSDWRRHMAALVEKTTRQLGGTWQWR